MAANPWAIYGNALEQIITNGIDQDTDAFRMVLVGTGYVPNQSTHTAWSDVSANEISGTGYTANGELVTISVSRSGLVVTVDGDDQSWASSTLTNVAYAVIVKDADANGALAAGDLLLAYCELENGGSVSTTNGTLTVTINANGIYQATAATAV